MSKETYLRNRDLIIGGRKRSPEAVCAERRQGVMEQLKLEEKKS